MTDNLIVPRRITRLMNGVALESPQLPLQIDERKPWYMEQREQTLFADFGNAVFGNLRMEFATESQGGSLRVRLGEKLAQDGTIDRNPPGSVNYREIELITKPGRREYQLDIPSKPFHFGKESVKMPPSIGEVTPFRYVEIEGMNIRPEFVSLKQVFVQAPFDDNAAHFACSDEGLTAVWELCRHTIKATTAFGVYIDGERERIPYEADAYINMLSHFAFDLDPRVARATMDHLLAFPTWPTEWSHHMPMMAAMDYLYTGDVSPVRKHLEALRKKLLLEKARPDGLLVASAIVDWPAGERDNYNNGIADPDQPKQVGPMVNTVANAFFYRAIVDQALLERACDHDDESRRLENSAEILRETFNRVFFDPECGLYVDGEGSNHVSLHANFFPLALGLVPAERVSKIAEYIESRGMACSVYGAQYLLEALFAAGRDDQAIRLMGGCGPRTWRHMIDAGSTMTWEAWDEKAKPNLTWNHPWGAAPANILPRFVLGVRPLTPGFSKILVAPRLGPLKWVAGKVPTPHGPVTVKIENCRIIRVEIEVPDGAQAFVKLPAREHCELLIDSKRIEAETKQRNLVGHLPPGRHLIESY